MEAVGFRVEPVVPPRPPTDPDVREARIRFLGGQRVGGPLAPPCAALSGRQM